jgi:hypothetical protein
MCQEREIFNRGHVKKVFLCRKSVYILNGTSTTKEEKFGGNGSAFSLIMINKGSQWSQLHTEERKRCECTGNVCLSGNDMPGTEAQFSR